MASPRPIAPRRPRPPVNHSMADSVPLRLDTVAASWPPDLPSPEGEASAFWRMRGRLAFTVLAQTLSRARFRVSLVATLSALLWLGLFYLFADGFLFLKNAITDPGFHQTMVEFVFAFFFAAMTMMLVFSAWIILYGSLFRSSDVALLLTIPARAERIFLFKLQEAILLSSWAFILLGSPMLLAYGIVSEAPWYYFAMLVPFLIAFTYIPAGIGGICCLLVVRFVPRARVIALVLLALAVFLLGVAVIWSITGGSSSELMTYGWLQELLGRFKVTQNRLLPSWWLSTGLLLAAGHEAVESVKFLGLLISNALFFRLLATWFAGRLYRSAYARVQSRGRFRATWVDHMLAGVSAAADRFVAAITAPLSQPMRLLILKDVRVFRRDPVQWSQFVIFFVLLVFYFINIRRFNYGAYYSGWVNMVSFLNVSVVGLLLSTFTTRFIFPMISLEGRRFWILGLLPLERSTILWSKFSFAAGGSILPCAGLILLSDTMLGVDTVILASHQLTCLILCVGLSGIAVGLGAKMPNLREQSPSRIAAGFGGTLNLVLSTLYIVAVVLLTALPSHFYLGMVAPRYGDIAGRMPMPQWLETWIVAGTVASLLLGVVATVVPMRMGFRAFRELEF